MEKLQFGVGQASMEPAVPVETATTQEVNRAMPDERTSLLEGTHLCNADMASRAEYKSTLPDADRKRHPGLLIWTFGLR
jgi:hypothetical protein